MGKPQTTDLDHAWKSLGNGEITALPTYVPEFDAVIDAAPAIDRELARLAAVEASEEKPVLPTHARPVESHMPLPRGVKRGQVTTTGRLVRPNDPGTRARVQREAQYVSDLDRWERRNAAAERKAARKRRR